MKEYQIIRNSCGGKPIYGVAKKEDIKNYYEIHFLPLVVSIHNKKDLIYIIENNEHYKELKENTDYRTAHI